jgi:hypothetical protein
LDNLQLLTDDVTAFAERENFEQGILAEREGSVRLTS